jgi:hypothetical protein
MEIESRKVAADSRKRSARAQTFILSQALARANLETSRAFFSLRMRFRFMQLFRCEDVMSFYAVISV